MIGVRDRRVRPGAVEFRPENRLKRGPCCVDVPAARMPRLDPPDTADERPVEPAARPLPPEHCRRVPIRGQRGRRNSRRPGRKIVGRQRRGRRHLRQPPVHRDLPNPRASRVIPLNQRRVHGTLHRGRSPPRGNPLGPDEHRNHAQHPDGHRSQRRMPPDTPPHPITPTPHRNPHTAARGRCPTAPVVAWPIPSRSSGAVTFTATRNTGKASTLDTRVFSCPTRQFTRAGSRSPVTVGRSRRSHTPTHHTG